LFGNISVFSFATFMVSLIHDLGVVRFAEGYTIWRIVLGRPEILPERLRVMNDQKLWRIWRKVIDLLYAAADRAEAEANPDERYYGLTGAEIRYLCEQRDLHRAARARNRMTDEEKEAIIARYNNFQPRN
jgi:hypothetical protein